MKNKSKCLVCRERIKKCILICGCSVCMDCICDWIIEENKRKLYTKFQGGIKCPNSKCNCLIEHKWFYKIMPKERVKELDEVLFQNYLNNTDSIQKCPVRNCKYAGFAKSGCYNFQCGLCSKTWTNENNSFTKLNQNIQESYSQIIMTLVYDKQCPSCLRTTYKYTGCNHITCVCTHQYCLVCYDSWHSGHICDPNKKSKCFPIQNLVNILYFIFLLKCYSAIGFYNGLIDGFTKFYILLFFVLFCLIILFVIIGLLNNFNLKIVYKVIFILSFIYMLGFGYFVFQLYYNVLNSRNYNVLHSEIQWMFLRIFSGIVFPFFHYFIFIDRIETGFKQFITKNYYN
jgi:hypothetical protein